jgi:hypothetical protein
LKEAAYFPGEISSHAKTNLQVQNLIERCLQLYMNRKEVVRTLSGQAKIEPSFTELGNTLVHS